MSFLWPGFLYCLGLVPLALAVYACGLRRRRRYAVRMSSLSLVREAAREGFGWRRHLPFGLFLAALTSVVFALGRPVVTVDAPAKQGTLILALDVSRSMCSPDIQPTRLEALEAALYRFIAAQRAGTKIGVVAFSDAADLVQPPTGDRTAVYRAIQGLMTGWKRAVGEGILQSLEAISGPGEEAPAAIVLVTNGASSTGRSPLEAARLAAERGVRIYTVGLSSPQGPLDVSCQSSDPSGFGREFQQEATGDGGPDVEVLQQIAQLTGGRYFPASGLAGLEDVFREEQLRTIRVREVVEVSVVLAALGGLWAAAAFLLALWWSPLR